MRFALNLYPPVLLRPGEARPRQQVGIVSCRRGGRRPASCVLHVVAGPPHPSASPGRLRPPPSAPSSPGAGPGLPACSVLSSRLVRWSAGRRPAAVPGVRGGLAAVHASLSPRAQPVPEALSPGVRVAPGLASLPRSPSPPSRCVALPAVGPRCPFGRRAASGLSAGSRSLRYRG